jgi:branched-subunit amino acid ABC-type transport system permease component
MESFLYQIFSGIANGSIYASVALALVMIYQATHHINFAQGEFVMLGGMLTIFFLTVFHLPLACLPLCYLVLHNLRIIL